MTAYIIAKKTNTFFTCTPEMACYRPPKKYLHNTFFQKWIYHVLAKGISFLKYINMRWFVYAYCHAKLREKVVTKFNKWWQSLTSPYIYFRLCSEYCTPFIKGIKIQTQWWAHMKCNPSQNWQSPNWRQWERILPCTALKENYNLMNRLI